MKPKRTVFQTFKDEEVLAGGQSNLKRLHRIYMPANLKVVEGKVEVVDLGAFVFKYIFRVVRSLLPKRHQELTLHVANPSESRPLIVFHIVWSYDAAEIPLGS